MSKTFIYTDSFDSPESDVIASAYYNGSSRELYVVTHRQDAYGYSDVPSYLFSHFKNSSSKGHFWNTAVKPQFKSISRGEPVTFAQYGVSQTVPAPAPAQAEYVVKYEVTGTLTITGSADSLDDALVKAAKIVGEQFSGDSKVIEVTRKFV